MSLGYSELPAKRRRGQISLWVQLLAIKVSPSFYTQLTEQNLKNKDVNTPVLPSHVQKLQENNTTFNFSGTENCQFENSCRLPSSPVWIDHTTIFKSTVDTKQSNTDDVKPKERAVKRARSHWGKLLLPFTCCFKVSKKAPSSPKTQSRNSIDNPSNANQINNETICNTNSQCNLPTETPRIPIVNCKSDQDTRTASRAILDTKSLEFYNAILENSSTLHDAVVKYLEQSSGVLVLDYKLGHFSRTSASVHSTSESVPALCIVLVATQSEIIRRLSEDCNLHSSIIEPTSKETDRSLQSDEVKTIPDKLMLTSKLADDLATVLIRAGVLQQLELQNLRLLTTLDPKEVEIAIKELLDMEE
uniref:UBA domain-containing protein n=1 Tax=Trichobilharzia regenti TaxID=157069 RepID=A0AA85KD29_TRIRE|nr:unnamed protein product [Trichobilharzia regenti]